MVASHFIRAQSNDLSKSDPQQVLYSSTIFKRILSDFVNYLIVETKIRHDFIFFAGCIGFAPISHHISLLHFLMRGCSRGFGRCWVIRRVALVIATAFMFPSVQCSTLAGVVQCARRPDPMFDLSTYRDLHVYTCTLFCVVRVS